MEVLEKEFEHTNHSEIIRKEDQCLLQVSVGWVDVKSAK